MGAKRRIIIWALDLDKGLGWVLDIDLKVIPTWAFYTPIKILKKKNPYMVILLVEIV